MSTVLIYCTSI